jgi:hypothetical protein
MGLNNQVGWTNPITGQDGQLVIDHIRSSDYLPGVSGWNLDKNGDAEFNNLTARGTLESNNYVPGVSGWQLNQAGNAEINALIARGSLTIVNGTSQMVLENDVSPGGGPGIVFNPDTGLYEDGIIYASGGLDPNTANLSVITPFDSAQAGAVSAALFLNSGYTGKRTLATIDAEIFQVFAGFAFEGLADSNKLTSNSAAIVPGTALDIVTVTIGAEAGCEYEISVTHRGVGFVTPVAFPGNRCQVRIMRNGAQIASNQILAGNTTLTQEGGGYLIHDTPGAGTFTYAFNILHDAASTAASVHSVAAADSPCEISVRGFNANI